VVLVSAARSWSIALENAAKPSLPTQRAVNSRLAGRLLRRSEAQPRWRPVAASWGCMAAYRAVTGIQFGGT